MISAVYSSNVFKDKDEFYESISIDMKRANERTGFAVIFFRQIEQQCFDYDENNVFMVTPDEWSYSEFHHHKLHNITRSQITKKLNEITTWAVQKFNVDDVGRMNHNCVMFRNETKSPFNDEHSIDDILRDGKMAEFETILQNSFGRHKTQDILEFFCHQFPELPKSVRVRESVMPKKAMYASWGEWA